MILYNPDYILISSGEKYGITLDILETVRQEYPYNNLIISVPVDALRSKSLRLSIYDFEINMESGDTICRIK